MKKLYKSRKEKMAFGVCGGIAEYFDLDPVLVRVLFIIFTFIGGTAVIAYLVGMLVMPYPPAETEGSTAEAPTPSTSDMEHNGAPAPVRASTPNGKGPLIFGVILVVLGAFFLLRDVSWFNHFYWWFRWNLSDYMVPAILIIFGALLIGNSRRQKENGQEG